MMYFHISLSPFKWLWVLTLLLLFGHGSAKAIRANWAMPDSRQLRHGQSQWRHYDVQRSRHYENQPKPKVIGTERTVEEKAKTSRDKRDANDIRETRQMIGAVAIYLQYHKFFDHDRRFGKKEGVFTKSFPQPPLRKLHKDVKYNCDKGFYECLHYVHKVTASTPMYNSIRIKTHRVTNIQHFLIAFLMSSRVHKEQLYKPFSGHLEQFQFRTTAAYYMCWYTMTEPKPMEFFLDSCNYWYLNHYRSKNNNKFDCALYSFCPDPCCADRTGGELPPKECKSYQGNPCRAVHDGRCAIDTAGSRSLSDLMLSKINVSCPCQEVKNGYTWSNQYAMCLDVDECLSGKHQCASDQVCRNTLGGYKCTCLRGYKQDPAVSDSCVQDPDAALVALKDEVTESPGPTDQGSPADLMGLGPYVDKIYDWLSGDGVGVRSHAWCVWLVAVLTMLMTGEAARWMKTCTSCWTS